MRETLRTFTVTTIVTVLVGTFGCATERPTQSVGSDSVPTANLSDNLIISLSDPISYTPERLRDTVGLEILLPDWLMRKHGPDPEVLLTHVHCTSCYCGYLEFEIKWPLADEWKVLDDPIGTRGCIGSPPLLRHRMLSLWGLPTGADRREFSNSLQVRGTFYRVDVQIATMSPNYRPALLGERVFQSNMTWANGNLISYQIATRRDIPNSVEIAWIDGKGAVEQIVNVPIDPNPLSRLIASDAGLWLISRGLGLWPLSSSGIPDANIRLEQPPGSFMFWDGAFWAEGFIWVPGYKGPPQELTGFGLLAIDPQASADSGYTVFAGHRPWPVRLRLAGDIEWSGQAYLALDYGRLMWDGDSTYITVPPQIFTVSAEGEITDSIPVPVDATNIAWDGEAYWISHRGTPELPSTDILLSRFYPR